MPTDDNQSNNQETSVKPVRYTLQQQAFLESDAARVARVELKLMANDPKYNTRETFSSRDTRGLSFIDKHMKYLSEHPKLNPRHYISNLKLMTKVKY